MQNKLSGENRKYFSLLFAFVLLLCSFFSVNNDNIVNLSDYSSQETAKHISQEYSVVLIAHAEEISSTQSLFGRHFSSGKSGLDNSRFFGNVFLYIGNIFLVFWTFHILTTGNINLSQKFIIRFIHDKDGQKA